MVDINGEPKISNGLSVPLPTLTFIPKSTDAAKSPPFMNQDCYGYDLSEDDIYGLREQHINLKLIITAYYLTENKSDFFLANNFFNKLAGNNLLMQQIKAGLNEDEIRLTWQDDLITFKEIRKTYLLYPDFE